VRLGCSATGAGGTSPECRACASRSALADARAEMERLAARREKQLRGTRRVNPDGGQSWPQSLRGNVCCSAVTYPDLSQGGPALVSSETAGLGRNSPPDKRQPQQPWGQHP